MLKSGIMNHPERLELDRPATAVELESLYHATVSCLKVHGVPFDEAIIFEGDIHGRELNADADVIQRLVPGAASTLEIEDSVILSMTLPLDGGPASQPEEGSYQQCSFFVHRQPKCEGEKAMRRNVIFGLTINDDGSFQGERHDITQFSTVVTGAIDSLGLLSDPAAGDLDDSDFNAMIEDNKANDELSKDMGLNQITFKEYQAFQEILDKTEEIVKAMKRKRLFMMVRHPLIFIQDNDHLWSNLVVDK